MKKTIKIVSTLLIMIMLMMLFSTVVMAGFADPGKVVGEMEKHTSTTGTEQVQNIGGQIASILTTVGIVIAVIVLLVLGIKYMIGSASEKAEYKKTMIPYLVGALLVMGASVIVKAVFAAVQVAG